MNLPAHNHTNRYESGCPNPMVRLQAPGLRHIHQTKVMDNTVNPVWEESFEFPIAPEEFDQNIDCLRYVLLATCNLNVQH